MERVVAKIAANYPVLWIPTVEYERASEELAKRIEEMGVEPRFSVYCWDVHRGMRQWDQTDWIAKYADTDPLYPISFALERENTVIILFDFDKFLSSIEVTRALLNACTDTEGRLVTFVILSPNLNIPQELERYVSVVDFELPKEKELLEKLKTICEVNEIAVPEDAEEIAKAGRGLTLFEFSRAVTLSVVETGTIDRKFIIEQKEQLVRKNQVLSLYHPESLDEIKGLDKARSFIEKAIYSGIGRGVLLLGVPGTGKSLLAKTMGKATGLPVIMLNFEGVFDRFVGGSEQKIREALKVIDAVAPCIVFIDEIEKGLSGIQSSSHTDGGTGARVFGTFLKWMNDRTSDTYVIATANDISKLPPEFLRAERWDAIFFVDLPSEEELEEMLSYYCNVFGVEKTISAKDVVGYTGAEIKSLCRTAKMLGISLSEAASFIKPIAKTLEREIDSLRKWAEGRCVPASTVKKKGKTARTARTAVIKK